MPIWIGLIALLVALPGSINACVSLYDRFLANRERQPMAATGRAWRWGLWAFNLISLALLSVVIVGTWIYPPSAPQNPPTLTQTAPPPGQLAAPIEPAKEGYAARSPHDAGREIPIIDQISDLLRDEMDPQAEEGKKIAEHWRDAFNASKTEAYFQQLTDYQTRVARSDQKLLAIVQKVPPFCTNDLCEILGVRQGDAVVRVFGKFQKVLASIRDIADLDKAGHLLYGGGIGPRAPQ
jgi:hypothetical protein